jgi:hypothetical protein
MIRKDDRRVKVETLDPFLDVSVQYPNPDRLAICAGISTLVC